MTVDDLVAEITPKGRGKVSFYLSRSIDLSPAHFPNFLSAKQVDIYIVKASLSEKSHQLNL